MKQSLSSKLFVGLTLLLVLTTLTLRAMYCPSLPAGERIIEQSRQWTQDFMNREDKYRLVGAQALGFGTEAAAYYLGNKLLPTIATIRFRGMNVPLGNLCAAGGAKIAGYAPPVAAYMYSNAAVPKNISNETPKPAATT